MVDLMKETSEFFNFILTDENAQLLIAIGVVGAVISAFTSIAIRYILMQQQA